jgi:glucose-6-phosphate 1-dehydrogenase
MTKLDAQFGTSPNRLFYISTPPAAFEPIITCLGKQRPASRDAKTFRRVIIEKPFGRDLASARALNDLLHRTFKEEQVFRIDHYLGKETVQNMMVMRFANSIFEPIWNYKYIDHVQITVSETLGVGSRGGYYDKSGAMRDMVQNHLFQLMALVAMEPPAALDAVSIRDEKVKVYKSVRPFDESHIDSFVVRGQYGAGEANGDKTAGYKKEKDVPATSPTETFVALKLFIDNWRWSGTPFYLRTGKFLPEKLSEVAVQFRSPPLTLFQKQCESPVYPNDLVIRVQPEEGISWQLNGKVPGGAMSIKPVAMDMFYKTTFNVEPPEAYERLIFDAMLGDQTLFIRGDEAEAAWAVIDPIEQAWAKSNAALPEYVPGSWGPKQAMALIELDGRRWRHTSDSGEPEPIIACTL